MSDKDLFNPPKTCSNEEQDGNLRGSDSDEEEQPQWEPSYPSEPSPSIDKLKKDAEVEVYGKIKNKHRKDWQKGKVFSVTQRGDDLSRTEVSIKFDNIPYCFVILELDKLRWRIKEGTAGASGSAPKN